MELSFLARKLQVFSFKVASVGWTYSQRVTRWQDPLAKCSSTPGTYWERREEICTWFINFFTKPPTSQKLQIILSLWGISDLKNKQTNFYKEWFSFILLLESVTNSMDMGLGRLQQLVMDREVWHAAVHVVAKSWTWLSDWTELSAMGVSIEIFFLISWPTWLLISRFSPVLSFVIHIKMTSF